MSDDLGNSPMKASSPGLFEEVSSFDEIFQIWRVELIRLILIGGMLPGLFVFGAAVIEHLRSNHVTGAFTYMAAYMLFVLLSLTSLKYHIKAVGLIYIIAGLGLVGLLEDGVEAESLLFFMAANVLSMMLLGKEASRIITILTALSIIFVGVTVFSGLYLPTGHPPTTSVEIWMTRGLIMIMLSIVVSLGLERLNGVIYQIQARDVKQREAQEDAFRALEKRLTEQTRSLTATLDVSQHLATISDPKDQVRSVVNLIQQQFGFNNVLIYLFDNARENLVMVGGTGDAGNQLLQHEYKILPGQGFVGRAAVSNRVVLITDTHEVMDWQPVPFLTETRSEVAVPIAVGERVIGVLNVQQNIAYGLTKQDASLLLLIANQFGVGFQSAHLDSIEQKRPDQEALVNIIDQKLQAAPTIEDVLKVAVSELGIALSVKQASIHLGDVMPVISIDTGDISIP